MWWFFVYLSVSYGVGKAAGGLYEYDTFRRVYKRG